MAGVSALAIGQPLLDVFGRSTETFVFRGIDRQGYVLFALVVVLLPPTLLWLAGILVGRLTPVSRRQAHLATTGTLVGLAALVAIRWTTGIRGASALAGAVALGVLLVVLAVRHPPVQRFLAYLAVLPAIALLSFMVSAPSSALLRGGVLDAAAAERSGAAGADRPVVMLVLDEFPTVSLLDADGAIDPVRFPQFARLADEAAWYRNYTTLSASTVRAVPSILTGEVPASGDEPLWVDQPDNLFTLLGGSHDLRVRETVTQLCPRSLCDDGAELSRTPTADTSGLVGLAEDSLGVIGQLLDPGSEPRVVIDAFEEELVSLEPVAPAGEDDDRATVQPARFADFVDDLVDADEPVLHFLHLILPHGPWRFTESGTEYDSPAIDPPGQIGGIWTDEWPATLTELRLELQARYTDILMGQVIDRLEASGLWDRATIVVVADHGGSFISGERGRAITDDNAFEVMWTPLFVRSPGLESGPTDVNAQAVDVLPTIAALGAVDLPFATDGSPLVQVDGTRIVPVDGVGGDSGIKSYARFTNAFQPEDDAVLDVHVDRELPRVLAAGRDVTSAEADDPIGSFHRSTPHGALYGKPIDALDVGRPAPVDLRLDQLDRLRDGAEQGALPAYVGGWTSSDLGGGRAEPWFAIALDGVVAALSPVFPGPDRDQAIATMIDPARLDRSGHDVTAYLVTTPGGPLRPVALS